MLKEKSVTDKKGSYLPVERELESELSFYFKQPRFYDEKEYGDIVLKIVNNVIKAPKCEFILSPRSYTYDKYYDEATGVNISYNFDIDIVRCEGYDVMIESRRVEIESKGRRMLLPLEIEGVMVKRKSS